LTDCEDVNEKELELEEKDKREGTERKD